MTFRVRSKWRTDSTCTIISSHPASINIGDKRSGSSTIKCASKGISTLSARSNRIRSYSQIWNKISIHYVQWIRSAPASSRASNSEPKRLKSAGRIEGHISIWRLFSVIQVLKVWATCSTTLLRKHSLACHNFFSFELCVVTCLLENDIRIQDTLGVERLFHFSKEPNLLFIPLDV